MSAGVRYHFSAARGALRSTDDGRTWAPLEEAQIARDIWLRCAYCNRAVPMSCLPSRLYAECWGCLLRARGRAVRHRGWRFRLAAWWRGHA